MDALTTRPPGLKKIPRFTTGPAKIFTSQEGIEPRFAALEAGALTTRATDLKKKKKKKPMSAALKEDAYPLGLARLDPQKSPLRKRESNPGLPL